MSSGLSSSTVEQDWESEERRLGIDVPYCIRFLRELLRNTQNQSSRSLDAAST